MKILWKGADATLVRLAPGEPKQNIEPGQTFEVDEDTAKFLLNYHRKTMVEAPDTAAEKEEAVLDGHPDTKEPETEAPETEEKALEDHPQMKRAVVTKKQRKNK